MLFFFKIVELFRGFDPLGSQGKKAGVCLHTCTEPDWN